MRAQVLQTGREQVRYAWAVPIASELEAVEARLIDVVGSDVPAAAQSTASLLAAGGKRIRPALVILSALAVNPDANRDAVVDLAAATELVHSASLMHDDVVDETKERRGTATSSAQWGNKISVLAGDFLLAKAFALLAGYEDFEIVKLLADTAIKMSESEILQASAEGDVSMWENNYWRIIRDKTARFMSACCQCGAIIAGASSDARAALGEYGIDLGIAFQVADDILDVVGDSSVTGKDAGTDLTHGKFTLPVILALRNLDYTRRQEVVEKLRAQKIAPEDAKDIAHLAAACGAVELSRQAAATHVDRAKSELQNLPESVYTQALSDMASFVVRRNK